LKSLKKCSLRIFHPNFITPKIFLLSVAEDDQISISNFELVSNPYAAND